MPELLQQRDIVTRMPPQNLEAEVALLGALLLDKNAIVKVGDLLQRDDFYKESHAKIFEAMVELYAKNEPIDILTLSEKLEGKKELEGVGGRAYLTKLSAAVATASHVVHYANIIQRKATLRRLITSAAEITELGYHEDQDLEELLDKAEQKLFNVSQKHMKNVFLPIDQLLSDAFERIDDLHKNAGKLRGIPTGFTDLDNILAGLQKSDLIILAARPSVGKTSLALDIARNAAVRYKAPVAIFSLEMGKEQLVDRMLCAEANIDLWKLRSGKLSDSENDNDFAKLSHGMGVLSEAPIYIDDSAGLNIMEIKTKVRRLQMEKGLGLVIIDYLQLMEGRGNYKDNRVQEVSEITRALKILAREMNVPVFALSQLSRSVEQSKPAIPKLSHLRESGSIEQDADIVMFLYRKSADRNYQLEEIPEHERAIGQIHIAKHRNGPTGVVNVYFNAQNASYRNLDKGMMRDAPPEF